LGIPVPRGAAWSNLLKVQLVNGDTANPLRGLKPDELEAILDWQRDLFDAEMKFSAPKRILCFTGPDYDDVLKRMIPDLKLLPVDGFDKRKLAFGNSPCYGVSVARTYHPSYLARSNQWHLIAEAVARLA
jgi:hypothetical protein